MRRLGESPESLARFFTLEFLARSSSPKFLARSFSPGGRNGSGGPDPEAGSAGTRERAPPPRRPLGVEPAGPGRLAGRRNRLCLRGGRPGGLIRPPGRTGRPGRPSLRARRSPPGAQRHCVAAWECRVPGRGGSPRRGRVVGLSLCASRSAAGHGRRVKRLRSPSRRAGPPAPRSRRGRIDLRFGRPRFAAPERLRRTLRCSVARVLVGNESAMKRRHYANSFS